MAVRTKTKKLVLPTVSIAAAGTTQGTATAMGNDAFVTVTAADGTKGVKLPEPTVGRICTVYNEHASSRLKVYPHSGGDINDGTTDAALLIDGKTIVLFQLMDANTWAAIEVNRITSPTLVTPLLDDGDAGLTLTSANQTSATATATFPDLGDAADTVVMADTTQTLTAKTLTNPTVNAASGTVVVPTSASPAQTVEGSVVWDSDDDLLTVGDGSARKTMVDLAGTQTLTNKTMTSPTLNTPVIKQTHEAHTAGDTLTAAESGSVHTNTGAGGAITIVLPVATVGQYFDFHVGAAQELRLDPNGTETIALPSSGVQGAAGKYLTADAVGEWVSLKCVIAGTWTPQGYAGTWTAEA